MQRPKTQVMGPSSKSEVSEQARQLIRVGKCYRLFDGLLTVALSDPRGHSEALQCILYFSPRLQAAIIALIIITERCEMEPSNCHHYHTTVTVQRGSFFILFFFFITPSNSLVTYAQPNSHISYSYSLPTPFSSL